jgi:hypothetical protein
MTRTKRTQTTAGAIAARWKGEWQAWMHAEEDRLRAAGLRAVVDRLLRGAEAGVYDAVEWQWDTLSESALRLLSLEPLPAAESHAWHAWHEAALSALPLDEDERQAQASDDDYGPTPAELTRWPHLVPLPPPEPAGVLDAALEIALGIDAEEEDALGEAEVCALCVARTLLFARHVRDHLAEALPSR